MRKRVAIIFAALTLLGVARGSDTIPAAPQAKPIAIKGATIHPVSGPDIPNGTIVFENGKITALGADVAIPSGADVIEANGKHVYPGLINANTVLGLVEIGDRKST